MFSRPDSDLIRLDSGHPHVFGALVFEGDALRYLEAVWMEGVGLPDQVDEASLERLMISARAHGYVLSVKERLPLRSSGGMRRERMYLAIENPDPLRTGGDGVTVHLRLGYAPTDTFTPDKATAAAARWLDASLAAVAARFPNAKVTGAARARARRGAEPPTDAPRDLHDRGRRRHRALTIRPSARGTRSDGARRPSPPPP
jgi:hypothetical protein